MDDRVAIILEKLSKYQSRSAPEDETDRVDAEVKWCIDLINSIYPRIQSLENEIIQVENSINSRINDINERISNIENLLGI